MATKLKIIPQEDIDSLSQEIGDYQLLEDEEVPATQEIARFWGLIGKMKTGARQRFGLLSKLVKSLLVIPHSNAASERTFSMVKKIMTDQRSSLENDTLCALLSAKFNIKGQCHLFKPSDALKRDAKKVTTAYNSGHCHEN